jgi:coenzyme F420 hydrogenase subunit beta
VIDPCTGERGRCFAYCPMTFFDADAVTHSVFGTSAQSGPLGHVDRIVASRARDEKLLSVGQAGGTVTALILHALKSGDLDCAVLTRVPSGEVYPQGFVATSPEEVVECAGSRYVGAHSLAALRTALDRGYRRIGLVGLPCQVRSVRKMGLYDIREENLGGRIVLVVGLFCNWAFSARDFTAYLSERLDLQGVTKIHIPPPPANVLEAETPAGTVRISLDDLRPLIQAACRECPDMTSDFADVSVGMYEGRPGWNTLIVRSSAGRKLVDSAVAEGIIEQDAFPAENITHLSEAAAHKRKRAT